MSLRQLLDNESNARLPQDTEVLEFQTAEADAVFETLASETARDALADLYQEPKTASELAANLDISLQNVNYHLNNLRDADLIEVADVKYSESGREMKVYSPSRNALILLSEKSTASRIRELISEVFAVTAFLAIMAVVYRFVIVEMVLGHPELEFQPRIDDGRDVAPGESVEIIRPLDHLPLFLDPGIAFLAGGILALCGLLAYVSFQNRCSV